MSTPSEGGPPWGLAWCLAFGQILSWGILYYTFAVVVGPMQTGTGWSRAFLNLGLSFGLLTWGVAAYPAGLWVQRRGARGLMTSASLVGALALALMAASHHPWVYLVAWVLLGAAMAGALYEPAFAVVTKAFAADYRRGITLITLVGGLASTVFIPLAQAAVDHLGWRPALFALALIQAGVGVPLHWWGIPPVVATPRDKPPANSGNRLSAWWTTFSADVRDPRFLGLAVWFSLHAAAFTGLMFQFIPLLQAQQVPSGTIVAALTVMGPMQVAGRLFLSARGADFSSLRVGLFAMGSLVLALLVLLLLPPSLLWLGVFTGVFGLGNGMLTIVRGTAVAEIFGRDRYAEINGALAAPAVLAKAAAPLVIAAVWSSTRAQVSVTLTVMALVMLSSLGLVYVVRLNAESRSGEPSGGVANS